MDGQLKAKVRIRVRSGKEYLQYQTEKWMIWIKEIGKLKLQI